MSIIGKVLKDCFTENDGESYCPVRVIGALLVVPAILLLLIFGGILIERNTLTLMSFVQTVGVMAGIVVTIFAAGVSLKAMTDKRPS